MGKDVKEYAQPASSQATMFAITQHSNWTALADDSSGNLVHMTT